jgi:hypothetical protein
MFTIWYRRVDSTMRFHTVVLEFSSIIDAQSAWDALKITKQMLSTRP